MADDTSTVARGIPDIVAFTPQAGLEAVGKAFEGRCHRVVKLPDQRLLCMSPLGSWL